VIKSSDVILIGNNSPEFADVRERVNGRHVIIDLVRAAGRNAVSDERYQGIGW
jgi:hypothetical protein